MAPSQLFRALSAQPSVRVIRRRLSYEELIDCAGLPVSSALKRSATEHPALRVHFREGHEAKKTSGEEVGELPPGLEDLLGGLGLEGHVDEARAWCHEFGAAFLEEIVENQFDFSEALTLSVEERRRLQDLLAELASAGLKSSPPEASNAKTVTLARGTTVSGHSGSAAMTAVMSAAPVSRSSLDRTCTFPVTLAEQGLAKMHVNTATVPLQAWRAVMAKPSPQVAPTSQLPSSRQEKVSETLLGPDEPPQSHRQKIRSSGHFYRMRDWSPPRYRITNPETWKAIRAPIPSATELNALATAQQRLAERASAQKPISSGAAAEDPPDLSSSSDFQDLQQNFLRRHGTEIREELPGVTLQPANLAPKVQTKFMSSIQESEVTVQPAYHGTKEQNIAPILATGLRVPGTGGVTVANGSAHGVGIYTAKLGASSLSRGFCDSDSFLVCAVADNATPPEKPQPESQFTHARVAAKWTGSGPCGSKHHRVTQISGAASAGSSSTQVNMLGNHQLFRQSADVRHVGSAMVVFDDARVAPLFVASGIGRSPHSSSYAAAMNSAGNQQRGVIPGGGFQTGRHQAMVGDEVMWVPPEAIQWKRATELRRNIESKQRDLKRQSRRDVKFNSLV